MMPRLGKHFGFTPADRCLIVLILIVGAAAFLPSVTWAADCVSGHNVPLALPCTFGNGELEVVSGTLIPPEKVEGHHHSLLNFVIDPVLGPGIQLEVDPNPVCFNGSQPCVPYSASELVGGVGTGSLTVTIQTVSGLPLIGDASVSFFNPTVIGTGRFTWRFQVTAGAQTFDTGLLDQTTTFQEFSFPPVSSITETITVTLDTGCGVPSGSCTGDATFTGAEANLSLEGKCPLTQGFWKNHPSAWPVTTLTLGSHTYTQAELLAILSTPVGSGPSADASLILADQLIAAKLDIARGSDPAPISAAIATADALLGGFPGKLPYKVKASTATGQAMVNDATILNNFNNGLLTSSCIP